MKILKSLSPTLTLGKYSIAEIAIPLVLLLAGVMLDVPLWIKLSLVIVSIMWWQNAKEFRQKRVKSFRSHLKLKMGITSLNRFPCKNKKEMTGV